jgi:hypothetical protein
MVGCVRCARKLETSYSPDRVAHILGVEDELDGSDVLPAFSVRVADIFT